jgi:hypothetical protein
VAEAILGRFTQLDASDAQDRRLLVSRDKYPATVSAIPWRRVEAAPDAEAGEAPIDDHSRQLSPAFRLHLIGKRGRGAEAQTETTGIKVPRHALVAGFRGEEVIIWRK